MILKAHGGKLKVVTKEGEFTEFTIVPLRVFISAGEKGDAGLCRRNVKDCCCR